MSLAGLIVGFVILCVPARGVLDANSVLVRLAAAGVEPFTPSRATPETPD